VLVIDDEEDTRELLTIALTQSGAEDAARARVAGYETHMPKPVAPSELILAVASLVAKGSVKMKST
jgi:CheY-like chemotaxis protein